MLGYDQCYRIKNHKLREKKNSSSSKSRKKQQESTITQSTDQNPNFKRDTRSVVTKSNEYLIEAIF